MKKKIVSFVIIFHLTLLASSFFLPSLVRKPAPKKHLVVKTITPSPLKTSSRAASAGPSSSKKIAAAPSKPAPKKTTPPKKAAPVEKKPAPSPSKKVVDKKEAPVKKQEPQIPKELLQELNESLAKLDEKPAKKAPKKIPEPLSAPQPLNSLSVDKKDTFTFDSFSTDSSYEDTLISTLHQSLNLPEYGEVKIRLTLRKDGSVISLKVISAESEKNKAYLEKNLPFLHFPHFTGPFTDRKEHTFILTFCNEI